MKAIGTRDSRRSNTAVRAVCACLVLAFMVTAAWPASAGTTDDACADGEVGDYVAGQLLVKFKDAASDDDMKDAKKAVDAKDKKDLESGIHMWKLGDDWDVEKALKELEKSKYDDVLEFAEPDYYVYADDLPTDPLRGDMWTMHNVGQTGGTADADIDMLEVWNDPPSLSTTEIIVGVIDTGIDYTHPELEDMMWTNPGEYGKTSGVDDDGNGYVDDIHGVDFVNDDGDPMDDNGHGSHCSGVIAAEGGNGVGVVGINSGIKLMGLKFLGSGGSGATSDALLAVNYAKAMGAKVTSNSWGGGGKSRAMETAIKGSGALFVASAGNSGSSQVQYPAGYTCDNVISVAATDHNDAKASWSNYGKTWVDLGAPGVNVMSCYLGGVYKMMSGTSMACPHVSGAAALYMKVNPSTAILDVKAKILGSVDTVSSMSGITVSGGRLNVKNMFTGTDELPSDSSSPAQLGDLMLDSTTSTSLTFTCTAVEEDADTTESFAYAYEVRYRVGTFTDSTSFDWATALSATGEPIPSVEGLTDTIVVTGLMASTDYTFAARAIDEVGNAGAVTLPENYGFGTTSPPDVTKWTVYSGIDSASGTTYHSMAYDANGNPAVAYPTGSGIMFAYYDGETWEKETVDSSVTGGGVDMVFDGSTFHIAYGDAATKYAKRTGDGSWSVSTIESRNTYGESKGIAVHGSGTTQTVGIIYLKFGGQGGRMFAELSGGTWTIKQVDKSAGGRYHNAAYDSSGNPHLVYCAMTGDNGNYIDIVKYATRSTSGTWSITTLASGVVGYGVHCDIVVDGEDHPHIITAGMNTGVVYFSNEGSGWTEEQVDIYGSCTSITVDGDNLPYIAYNGKATDGKTYLWVSHMMDDGTWAHETVETGARTTFWSAVRYYTTTDGTVEKLGVSYAYYVANLGGVHYAERDLKDTTFEWGD